MRNYFSRKEGWRGGKGVLKNATNGEIELGQKYANEPGVSPYAKDMS